MGNYFSDFVKAAGEADFLEMTYYAIGIFLAILILFLVSRLIKSNVNKRVRSIQNFTLDFDDLKKFRRTGLVSDGEFEKIKSGLVQRFTKSTREDLQESKKISQDLPFDIEHFTRDGKEKAAPNMPAAPAKTPSRPSPSHKPIDIDHLLKKGLISQEEYQRLTEISRKKNPDK